MTTPAKLLLVDDQVENIQVLAECLSDTYRIQFARSGPQALALAQQALPDLILLDVMMPDMDGYEVCDRLKKDPKTLDIPIIFVTAKNDAASESRALTSGAVDFIHKPVNRDVVRARVQIHLALKARERQLRQLTYELNQANSELHQLNDELERRVEERTQALRDSMLLTEAAQKSRNLFLANVNHELRTPMNAIMGFSNIFARELGDSKLKERAVRITEAGRELLSAVNAIIDIADLQAGKIQIDTIDFDLSKLLDEAIDTWRTKAETKGLGLTLEIEASMPLVLRGDAKRLGQILDNLLSNAVKFSHQGQITLRVRHSKVLESRIQVRFEVQDQGIGIPVEKQASLFKVFEQADYSNTRVYGGMGIGLAISKQLASLMNGGIGLESTPGVGSIFWVVIPLEIGITPPEITEPAINLGQTQAQQRLLLEALIGYLSEEDELQAYVVWLGNRDLIDQALGEHAKAFSLAMENFDAHQALERIRSIQPLLPCFASAGNGLIGE